MSTAASDDDNSNAGTAGEETPLRAEFVPLTGGSSAPTASEAKEKEMKTERSRDDSLGITLGTEIERKYTPKPNITPQTFSPPPHADSVDHGVPSVPPDDNDYDEEDEPAETSNESAAEVFSRPLMYYKRTTERDSQSTRVQTTSSSNPIEVVLPSGSISLGFPPKKGTEDDDSEDAKRNERNDRMFRHMVVFTQPTDEQIGRARFLQCVFLLLLPCDLALVTALYADPSIATNTTYSDGVYSSLAFGLTILEYCLVILSVVFSNVRTMTIFICCFYIDAILNLIREYSILQFIHFILQLGIAHCVSQLKQALQPSWFVPIH